MGPGADRRAKPSLTDAGALSRPGRMSAPGPERRIQPVILSGGEGRRLWPLSRPERPKQFLALTGADTLLQQTVRRLSDPAMFQPPIIVGGAGQRFLIAEQLRAANLAAKRIVLEPMGRNTAPALAVGA